MKFTLLLRVANKENLVALKKVMDRALAEAPQYLTKVKQEQQKIVSDKIKHLNKWYTKIIGLDEVRVYQERVTALQDQLLTTQSKRRELNTQLTEIRHKAQEIQSQIQHIDRKEKFDVYCQLINDERMILNLERTVTATFQEYDQAERDLFTAFTNAVRDSQEKQRAQLEYSKYIGVVLSLIGSFLAFVYTFFWKQDLKLYMHQQISSLQHITTPLKNSKEEMDLIIKEKMNLILKEKMDLIIKNMEKTKFESYNGQQESYESNLYLPIIKYTCIGVTGIIVFKLLFG